MTEKDIVLTKAISNKNTYYLFRGDFEQVTINVIEDNKWWADKILTLKERLKVNKTVINNGKQDRTFCN